MPHDLVVLGGGPGGYAAALYGAAAGLDVALIEEDRVGGTCLHRGCIPAKALLQSAEVLRTVVSAKDFGVKVPGPAKGAPATARPTLDLSVLNDRKRKVIDQLTKGVESLLAGRKVTVHTAPGEITSVENPTIGLPDGTQVTGKNLILATGSTPRGLAGFEFDGKKVLSSDHVLELHEIPSRVVIVGGGAIGCEFASFYADAGSAVTIVETLPRILAGADSAISEIVARSFRRRDITVRAAMAISPPETDSASGDMILTISQLDGSKPEKIATDAVVICVGRRPRSQGSGITEVGIVLTDAGFVKTDDHMRTNVRNVYAVGDLVATPQLAHVAFAEAIVAVRSILGESVTPIDYGKVPWVVYCHPEVAFCGMTEEAAKAAGIEVVVSTHRFSGSGRAMIMGETEGAVKVVAEKDGAILGVHVAGPWATELLGEGYLAVNWEASIEDVASLVHPHPTLSELFGEAALSLAGRSLHG